MKEQKPKLEYEIPEIVTVITPDEIRDIEQPCAFVCPPGSPTVPKGRPQFCIPLIAPFVPAGCSPRSLIPGLFPPGGGAPPTAPPTHPPTAHNPCYPAHNPCAPAYYPCAPYYGY